MEADELKSVRVSLGLTVKELARGLNVSQNSVERWESGENKPVGMPEAIYEAFQMVIARVPERARSIGAQLRMGLGAMIFQLLMEERAALVAEAEDREFVPPLEPAPKTDPRVPLKTQTKKKTTKRRAT